MEGSKVKAILQAAAEAQGEDRKALQQVIAQGKVGVVDDDGNTPLMYAATSGREEVLRMLLDKVCLATNGLEKEGQGSRYIDQQNRYGWTALMQAACYGHSSAVLLLLQRGAELEVKNSWKASALVLASQGGHFGVTHTLINHGAKVDSGVGEDLISCTLTPLMAAAQCGHVEVVEELLRGGAKPEVKLQGTHWTALMFAVLNNKVGVVGQLLQAGADKEAQDIEGKTPVDLATGLGHQGVLTLLAGGSIKNISDSEFFEAVSKGNVKKVAETLAEHPNMANIEDKDGATPLMFASNKGHCEVCEVLLEAKADVNTRDRKYGWTALMHATHNRRYEVAQRLGQCGADVNVRDHNNSTAYDIASVIGDIRMIKLIANITVERLQGKNKPTAAETKNTPTKPTVDKATPTDRAMNKPARPIDLSVLRSRLQNAYRSPMPKIAVPEGDSSPVQSPNSSRLLSPSRFPAVSGNPRFPSSPQPSGAPRFPSGRLNRLSASSTTPSNDLSPSPTPSPSKSSGSLPRPQRSPQSPFARPNFTPTKGAKASPTHLSTGGQKSRNALGGTPKGMAPQRKRANTDSVFAQAQRDKTVPDLKSMLEQSALEKYFHVFQEQEMDYHSFLTLCQEDLIEMGISDPQDRQRLMALVHSNTGSSSMLLDSDVFK